MTAVSANKFLQLLRMLWSAVLLVLRSALRLLSPQPAKTLAGEVVLVTGAGSQLGRSLALQLGARGGTVVCVDADAHACQLTVHGVNSQLQRPAAHAYTCDVRNREQVAALARRVGRVDILVNIAHAQLAPTPTDAISQELLAHFWTTLAFLPGMVQRKHGHVVAVSSGEEPSGVAVTGFMDAISEEFSLESHNIKLTCVRACAVRLPEELNLKISELSVEHAAHEIVNGVVHQVAALSVPRSLPLWLSALRTQPQDAKEAWRDVLQARGIASHSGSLPTKT